MRTFPHCRHCRSNDFGCPEENRRVYHVVPCDRASCSGARAHVNEREDNKMPGGNTHDRLVTRMNKAFAGRRAAESETTNAE